MIFIKSTKYNKKIKSQYRDIVAADFETLIFQNQHYVFSIGIHYDTDKCKFWFIDEFKDDKEYILSKSMNIIEDFLHFMIDNFKSPKIYFHNFGRFDSIFLIEYFRYKKENYKDSLNIILRNNRFYKITFKNLYFFDSFLILPSSLDKLANIFLNERKKEIDYNIFSSFEEIEKNREGIIIYLLKDVELLYKIILLIYNRFLYSYNVSIFSNFTLPSIAFKIFRDDFLNNNEIQVSKGYIYDFVKLSYFGGLNSVVIPHLSEKGYVYDVNSLYPFIMSNNLFPIGEGVWCYDIISLEDFFGYIECSVYIPDELYIPPLSIKENNVLVQKVGVIKGVFFSEELKNSFKYGCKVIRIFKGLRFLNKKNLFKEYIEDMYQKRINSNNTIDNYVYKMLMNSLYGRFGLNNEITRTKFVEEKDLKIYEILYNVENYLTDNIISYKVDYDNVEILKRDIKNILLNDFEKEKILLEINSIQFERDNIVTAIQIASAITAYSRMYMINIMIEHIKNNDAKIYYYDTDSIHTNKKLDDNIVCEKTLGKFKLEYIVKEAVYLSPKIYCLKKDDDTDIIKFKGLLKSDNEKCLSFYDFKNKLIKGSDFEFLNIKKIKIDWKNISIKNIISKFKTSFVTKKYEKIYNNKGVWIKNIWKKK